MPASGIVKEQESVLPRTGGREETCLEKHTDDSLTRAGFVLKMCFIDWFRPLLICVWCNTKSS